MESHNNDRPSAEQRSTAIAYRPRSFSELVGQEFVAHAITNALERQAVAHAYLLCGPRGVGKTTTARLLAQYLNHGGESTDQQWEAIRNGSGLDVIEIDGASNTSVQDVRQIKENILYPPQGSRYKIYIIDEVHMLSTSAFNALLKTIEEPPPYVVFIFATTEAEKLPMTVRSRCQQFHFRLIPTDVIAKQLTEVAAKLEIAINQEVVHWIATEAQGSMRDAYTLFDQLSVLGDDLLDLDALRKHFGFAETKQLAELIVLLSKREVATAMQLFDTILNAGVSIESICNDMTQLYRALLMHSYGIEVSHTEMIPSELTASLAVYTDVELLAIIEELVNVFQSLKDSLNPRFSCELALARIGYVKDRVTAQDIHNTLANMSGGSSVPHVSGETATPSTVGTASTVGVSSAVGSGGVAGAVGVTAGASRVVNKFGTEGASGSSSVSGVANNLGGTSAAGASHATATQSTGTLDPFVAHTSESLRTELTKGIGGEAEGVVHGSVVTAEQKEVPDEGMGVATPISDEHTSNNEHDASSVDRAHLSNTSVATNSPSASETATGTIASHDSAVSTNAHNQPLATNDSRTAIQSPSPAAHLHTDSAHSETTTVSTAPKHPPQTSHEISIDDISQLVNNAVVDKPIIHNLLVHDCTWNRHQTTVTIAAPSEFDKTTLEPYHHALTEAIRALWGQSHTVSLSIAARDSNTDKLISMTKKMFNAVE